MAYLLGKLGLSNIYADSRFLGLNGEYLATAYFNAYPNNPETIKIVALALTTPAASYQQLVDLINNTDQTIQRLVVNKAVRFMPTYPAGIYASSNPSLFNTWKQFYNSGTADNPILSIAGVQTAIDTSAIEAAQQRLQQQQIQQEAVAAAAAQQAARTQEYANQVSLEAQQATEDQTESAAKQAAQIQLAADRAAFLAAEAKQAVELTAAAISSVPASNVPQLFSQEKIQPLPKNFLSWIIIGTATIFLLANYHHQRNKE
jgi:membrane peptidoglycan carboxypeptidase